MNENDPSTWTDEDFDKYERQRSHEYMLAMCSLGQNLSAAAGLYCAFIMGRSRERFVSDQIDGWFDEDEEGPWEPGRSETAVCMLERGLRRSRS